MSTWSGWDSFCSSGQWFHIKVGGYQKPFFYLYDTRMETDLNPLQGRSPDDFDGGLPHHLPYGTTKRF